MKKCVECWAVVSWYIWEGGNVINALFFVLFLFSASDAAIYSLFPTLLRVLSLENVKSESNANVTFTNDKRMCRSSINGRRLHIPRYNQNGRPILQYILPLKTKRQLPLGYCQRSMAPDNLDSMPSCPPNPKVKIDRFRKPHPPWSSDFRIAMQHHQMLYLPLPPFGNGLEEELSISLVYQSALRFWDDGLLLTWRV